MKIKEILLMWPSGHSSVIPCDIYVTGTTAENELIRSVLAFFVAFEQPLPEITLNRVLPIKREQVATALLEKM